VALQYPGEWRFEGIGFGIPNGAVNEFVELVIDIARGSKSPLETLKKAFGGTGSSTDFSWAVTDLRNLMDERSSNAALFVDNLWSGIEMLNSQGIPTPSHRVLNKILSNHGVALQVEPPRLLSVRGDAIVVSDPPPTETARPVPTFLLRDKIGAGGYGVVYRAIRSTAVADFEYALKVLDPSPFVADYEKALRRFQREVKALQALQHRAIVQYFEAGLTSDNKPYVVMPLINGTDLKVATSSMSPSQVIDVFREIAEALQHAHERDVIHRDLKPSNIIVRQTDGQPIVVDFGSAYMLDDIDSKSLTTGVVGTIGYIPSEVLADPKKRSPRQDIYACGIMLYEVFAGYKPDSADYVPLAKLKEQYKSLDGIIVRAIASESKRTQTAAELRSQLVELTDL
jgi:serine/threonine protein kinase